MKEVKAKKRLGQHFLNDEHIAATIASLFEDKNEIKKVLEIGPGMGVLTKYLLNKYSEVAAIELDEESVNYLLSNGAFKNLKLMQGDILNKEIQLRALTDEMAIIGNFPYNISSQIVFMVLENMDKVKYFGGMFQKEVAERLVAKHGSKTYGILSVLLNTFYYTKYEFTVDAHVFLPPPKVKSGVISCVRKEGFVLPVDKKIYYDVIKTAFSMRRKMLRNTLHKFNLPSTHEFAKLRAEELSVDDFIKLTIEISENR